MKYFVSDFCMNSKYATILRDDTFALFFDSINGLFFPLVEYWIDAGEWRFCIVDEEGFVSEFTPSNDMKRFVECIYNNYKGEITA